MQSSEAWLRLEDPVSSSSLVWLPGQSWLAVGRRPQFLSTWVSPWCYRYSSLQCDGWFPRTERMHPKRAGQKPQSLLWVASEVTLQPNLLMVSGVSPVLCGVALHKGLNARRQESPFRDCYHWCYLSHFLYFIFWSLLLQSISILFISLLQ